MVCLFIFLDAGCFATDLASPAAEATVGQRADDCDVPDKRFPVCHGTNVNPTENAI